MSESGGQSARGYAKDRGRALSRSRSRALENFLNTRKSDTPILGDVQRYLLTRPASHRRQDCIHPSEMSRKEWCHRATYYRIVGTPLLTDISSGSYTLETVWAEGHDIHRKWQGWLWEMGRLSGMWTCRYCGEYWWDLSPKICPNGCGAGQPNTRRLLEYREVPVADEDHLIAGHSDGLDSYSDALLEIKSIGLGTLRFEAPALLSQHGDNLDAIWRAIRRPFPSHVRQGLIYLYCAKNDPRLAHIKRIVFIYEYKPNQQTKGFSVRMNLDLLEPLLEACLDIKYAIKKGSPPPCPHGGCTDCVAYERSTNGTKDREVGNTEPHVGTWAGVSGGEGETEAGGDSLTGSADLLDPGHPERPRRTLRRPSDKTPRQTDTLGGLSEYRRRSR